MAGRSPWSFGHSGSSWRIPSAATYPPHHCARDTVTAVLQAQKPQPATKLEGKFFTDYSKGGALFTVLDKLCAIKAEDEDMRRFDFTTPAKRGKNLFM